MSAMHNPDRSLDAAAFVTRWQGRAGSERANAQIFVGELCTLLGVPLPDPSQEGRPAPRSTEALQARQKSCVCATWVLPLTACRWPTGR